MTTHAWMTVSEINEWADRYNLDAIKRALKSVELSGSPHEISDVYIPDQTLFGDSYKFYFANFNFNKNPITTNFYNPTAWAVLGVWAPSTQLAFAGGVLDLNGLFPTNSFFVAGGSTGAGWTLYPPQAILPGTPGSTGGIILNGHRQRTQLE